MFTDGKKIVYNKVVNSRDNVIAFENELKEDVVDKTILPKKIISTCEFSIEVSYNDIVEFYDQMSFNVVAPNYVEKKIAKSDLVEVHYLEDNKEIIPPFEQLVGKEKSVGSVSFTGGSNGSISNISAADFIGEDRGAGRRTGIQSFLDNDVVSLIAIPGVTDPNVQLTLVAHYENTGSRFAVLDIPKDARKVEDIIAHRNIFDTNYAALYHPWLTVFDPLDKKNISIPPSGSMLGIYARSDNTRGVHKAPANEVVRGCVGLDCQFNTGEQDILNPKGVNLKELLLDKVYVYGEQEQQQVIVVGNI